MSTPQTRWTLRDQQKASTRAQLMRSALACVAEGGYGATTVEHVVDRAGISRATFYLHFSSKAELARAIIEDLRRRSAELLPPDRINGLTHDQLTTVVRRWIGFYRDEIDAFRLWYEASAIEPGLDAAIDTAHSPFVAALVGGARWKSRAAAGRAGVVVAMMILQLDRLCYAWFASGWPMREEVVIEEVVRCWEEFFVPRLRELATPLPA